MGKKIYFLSGDDNSNSKGGLVRLLVMSSCATAASDTSPSCWLACCAAAAALEALEAVTPEPAQVEFGCQLLATDLVAGNSKGAFFS